MRRLLHRLSIFLRQRSHLVYEFLKQNGFFDEMVRGIVKLVFFIIVLYCFKQAVMSARVVRCWVKSRNERNP